MASKHYIVQVTEIMISNIEVVASSRQRAVELARDRDGLLLNRDSGHEQFKIVREIDNAL